jgi:hypothetical protein
MNGMKVMTVRLDEKVVKELDAQLQELRLRRDQYLRGRLPIEIEELADLDPNSEFAASYIQLRRQGRATSRVKIGLKLPEDLIGRINEVCAEKFVPRDLFIETFFRFLAYGWPEEGVISPLVKAADYLRDPYRDVDGAKKLYKKSCHLTDRQVHLMQELGALNNVPDDAVASEE